MKITMHSASKCKQTRKSSQYLHATRQSQRGSAYKGILRPDDTISDYSIRYINAHGEISPEIFYVVPNNVFILLPNVCGVPTSVTHTVSAPIYINKDEARDIFRKKFITGELSTIGTQFTVFVPGDIIFMQTFIFSPIVGRREPKFIKFGFVGVFDESALLVNPLYNEIKMSRLPEYDNIFYLNLSAAQKFLFSVLNFFRIHFINDFKGKKPSGSLWKLYRYITGILYKDKEHVSLPTISTENLLKYNSRIVFSNPEISTLTNYYKEKSRELPTLINAIPMNDIRTTISYLLPLIPENLIAPLLADKYLENIDTKGAKMQNISLKTVIDKTRDIEKPTYFVINSCRSLIERRIESFNNETPALINEKSRYEIINMAKPSSRLVSKIDELALNKGDDFRTGLNIKNINEIRKSAGLREIRQDVFHYSELLAILRETIGTDRLITNNSYSILKERLREAIVELELYKPIEETRATMQIKGEASAAAESVAAIEAAEIAAGVKSKRRELEKNIETTRKTIAKLKLNVKYNKTKKVELDEKQALLKRLKETLETNTLINKN
jgi:hypothetical protein